MPHPWSEYLFSDAVPVASVTVGGKRTALCPAQMHKLEDGLFGLELDGVTVTLELARDAEASAACWLVRLENRGDRNTPQITAQYGCDLTLPVPPGAELRWESLLGDNCDAQAFWPRAETPGVGDSFLVEPTGGRPSDRSGFPFFDLVCRHADGTGQGLTCGIGWSGQWRLGVARDEDEARLTVSVADADFYLRPGETARMPRVLMLARDTACVDTLRRDFRRLLRRRFSPAVEHGERMYTPIAIQNFDRYFAAWDPDTVQARHQRLDEYGPTPDWSTEAMQCKQVADAARCGYFDTYWLDAAWFRGQFPTGVGNYSLHSGFPNGLRPISDAARAAGMRFMLWFEPARVYEDTEVFREHRGFLLDNPEGDGKNFLFNYGDEEALGWLIQTIGDFIAQNGVDLYRQDYNLDPLPYWRGADEPGRRGLTEIRFVEGLYRFWDALHERFPEMLIDNCSSGGRCIDLETCRRALPLWRSDTGCGPTLPGRPVDLWQQNQTLALTRYLPYHATSSWDVNGYRMRSGSTTGIALSLPFEDPAFDPAPVRTALAELVRLRPYWRGDFYGHTPPTLDDDVWVSYQFHLPEENAGYAVAFRRPACGQDAYRIPFAALDPEAEYEVQVTDEQYTTAAPFRVIGRELREFVVEADRYESVVVEYRAVQE